ncbi:unnamed protein product [Urochloa humidicola]
MEAEWIGRSGRGSSRRTKVLAQVDLGRRFQATALFLFQGAADSKAGSTAGDANRRSGGQKSESAARIDGAEVGGANHGVNRQRRGRGAAEGGGCGWMERCAAARRIHELPPPSSLPLSPPLPSLSLNWRVARTGCSLLRGDA